MSQEINKFNPIKEDTDGKRARSVVWSTDTIEMAINGLGQGKKLIANPFYEFNTKLLKGELVFQRTPEEEDEFIRCMNDIVYFAEKYCKLMTPEGIKNVSLREYQKNYLRHLEKHNLSIFLSCRQSGKCLLFTTNVKIKSLDDLEVKVSRKMKRYLTSRYYNVEYNYYIMPFFELYNIFNKSFRWKLKYFIYKIIYRLESDEKNLKFLYKLLEFLNEESDDKILHSFDSSGIEILTDEGWSKMTHIHETKPFDVYELVLDNGMSIECADNHIVFCKNNVEKYVKDLTSEDLVRTQYGLSRVNSVIKKRICVNMVDCTVDNEKHSYYTNGILSHNTTTSAIFLLHYILFNVDKNSLVLGNKRKTAVEILDKIKKIFYEIPHFLKPGVLKWNESEIAFDNGCRCMAEATTINSGISFTFHCVLADEFAHIAPNILEKFYNNLFPTITAGKARFIISSTQNGFNLFQRLYTAAEAHENDYGAFRTDWWEVPEWNPDKRCWEKRDEEWRQRQIANYGGEEAFEAQFGTRFMILANSLIDSKYLTIKFRDAQTFVNKDFIIPDYESFYWKPDYEPAEMLKREPIIITIDLSEGIGKDYTVFNIMRLYFTGLWTEPKFETVGYLKTNKISLRDCAVILSSLISNYVNQDHCIVSIENNTYGELFYKYVKDLEDMYNIQSNIFIRHEVFGEDGKISRQGIGVKMTRTTKPIYCSLLKQLFENGTLNNTSIEFLRQLENFADVKQNGSYEALVGNDDLVMSMVQMAGVMQTMKYRIFIEEAQTMFNTVQDEEFFDMYNFGGNGMMFPSGELLL